MSALVKLRSMILARGCYYTDDFFAVMAAILELDDRTSTRAPAPACAPLPEDWTIDEDGEACYRGVPKAFVDNVGNLVLRDVGIGASRPRIPVAVARALLARHE